MLFDTTIILSLLYIFQFCNKKDLQLFETQVGCGVKITWVLQKGSREPVPVLLGTLIIGTFGCVLSSITKSRDHLLVMCLLHALNSKLTAIRCPTLTTNCEEHVGF